MIDGGDGDDSVNGGAGNDMFAGGAGDDSSSLAGAIRLQISGMAAM